MNEIALRRRVTSFRRLFKSFERLLKLSERASEGSDLVARTLCELYAMMTALQIRGCMDLVDGIQKGSTSWEDSQVRLGRQEELPKFDAVEGAAQSLFSALESGDKIGMCLALDELGVFSLCPIPEQQFPKMETVAGRLIGRAQLIPLVELAHFATQIGDYQKAREYAQKALAFQPRSWELYNLSIVQGLIVLNEGDIRGAIWQLDMSISSCLADENTHLTSTIFGPNLALARKLLECGERIEVLRHLTQCKDVWHLFRGHFEKWIIQIENGETRDFLASEVFEEMNEPSYRLKLQWMNACSLGGLPGSASLIGHK